MTFIEAFMDEIEKIAKGEVASFYKLRGGAQPSKSTYTPNRVFNKDRSKFQGTAKKVVPVRGEFKNPSKPALDSTEFKDIRARVQARKDKADAARPTYEHAPEPKPEPKPKAEVAKPQTFYQKHRGKILGGAAATAGLAGLGLGAAGVLRGAAASAEKDAKTTQYAPSGYYA